MSGNERGPVVPICPSCGAALQLGLDDQFFCEHCGAPLGEEKQQSVLPDWLQDVPAEAGDDLGGGPDSLDSVAGTAHGEGPTQTRIELRPTGAARSRPSTAGPKSGISCTLVLGIAFFLAALCLLGWVLFAIVRQRSPEPASWLTASYRVSMCIDQLWAPGRVHALEEGVAVTDSVGRGWEDWGDSRARKQLQGAAGFFAEHCMSLGSEGGRGRCNRSSAPSVVMEARLIL
jgi:hypothetical protein